MSRDAATAPRRVSAVRERLLMGLRVRSGRSGRAPRLSAIPRPLALILAVACVQSLAWAFVMAPLQGPDESAHVAYVQHLAETGHTPDGNQGTGIVSTEQVQALFWGQLKPLVGVPAARPGWSDVERAEFERAERSLPASARKDGSGPNAVAPNPPLYYAYESIPYRVFSGGSFFTRVLAMRLANIPLYLATILFVWLLAGELFSRRWLQVVATATVALQPQLAFLSGVVNPDTLLTTLWAAFAYLAVRLVRTGPSLGPMVALGAVSGASVFTHGRGFAIVPPALVAVAVILWRHRRPPKESAVLAGGTLAALGVGALGALAFSGSGGGPASLGGEVSRAASQAFNVREFLSYVWQFYLPKLGTMTDAIGPPYGYRQVYIETFYGTFGSLEIVYRTVVYDLLQVASALGLVALWTAIVVRVRDLVRRWDVLLVLVSLAVSLLAVLHISAYRDLQVTEDPLLVGRYLLPIIPLFGIAIAFVVGALPRRAGAAAAGAIVSAGILLQLSGLGLTLTRFYA